MRRRGRLTEADIEAWRSVAATISRRMPGASLPTKPEVKSEARPDMPMRGVLNQATTRPPAPTAPGWSPPAQVRNPSPAGVERALRRRIASGRQDIDASLDLHGCRQAEAHTRLNAFVTRAHREGHRLVLVVTGKGRSGDEERGVLRRLVPMWLAEANLSPLVVGFGAAGRGHGDEGALYVHLRRRGISPRD